MENYIVEMLNITKQFPGVIANDNVNLQIKKGEIHALLGENGAGKSTLMSILFGLYQPEAGIIRINNKTVKINNPNDANDLGIGMVHQHFKLVDVFTVLENIILGFEPLKKGFLDIKKARERINQLSEQYGLMVNPDYLIEDITVGMQQRVEILKMLYRDNEILIFDEPTAVLTPQEIDDLIKIMKRLASEGKSIIFISHKLNEILKVANRCTVLRKGKYIGTVNVKDTTIEELSNMMVGRKVNLKVEKADITPKDIILEVSNLYVHSKLHNNFANKNVSFNVRQGEIVCLAGIEGNGQSEFVYALTGIEKVSSGSIKLRNHEITKAPIRMRSKLGMSHIPEDRHKHGLVLDYSLEENLVLQIYWEPGYRKGWFIDKIAVRKYANNLIQKYDIRAGQGPITIVRSMSGGNQQKAIVAREIDKNHDLLIAVQPTRGLDIGAVEYIHKQLIKERDQGRAVLLVSLELDEVLNISDRILVMYEGEIVGELDPKTTSAEELGLYMSGAKRQGEMRA